MLKADKIRDRTVLAMKKILSEHPTIKTRQAFAQRIGTTPAAINKWENRRGSPTLENIADICLEFNISPDYLILGSGEMQGSTATRLDELTDRISNIERSVFKKRIQR